MAGWHQVLGAIAVGPLLLAGGAAETVVDENVHGWVCLVTVEVGPGDSGTVCDWAGVCLTYDSFDAVFLVAAGLDSGSQVSVFFDARTVELTADKPASLEFGVFGNACVTRFSYGADVAGRAYLQIAALAER